MQVLPATHSLCKLSTAVNDLNQHAIYCITLKISNMKFIPPMRSCIHQSGLQTGFVTFSKRTTQKFIKESGCRKEKYRESLVSCEGEREKEDRAETNRKFKPGVCEVIDESLADITDSGDSS